ncbi:hypothetical protein JCM11641_004117 [Rhodosporidiobolus odoratus]
MNIDLDKEPTTLFDYTLRTAPLAVVYNSAAITALGATAGGTAAVLRNTPAIPAAFKTAIRTGVFGFTFFSIREYALIPLLTTASLHPSPLPSPSSSSTSALAQSSPHTHNLLPTTLSGLLAGTAFSYLQRSSPSVPSTTHARAGLTLALGCVVLQGIVNEADVVRIKLLGWGEERERIKREQAVDAGDGPSLAPTGPTVPSSTSGPISAPSPASHVPSAASSSAPAPPPPNPYLTDLTQAPHPSSPSFSDPGRETFAERSDRLFLDAWTWIKAKAATVSPVKKMQEGEYESKMRGVLKGVEEERERVRRERMELEALEKILEKVEGKGRA